MIVRPKSVFVVITTSGLIVGCFYSEEAASKYVGHKMQLKELPVETHGIKIKLMERILNFFNL